MNIFKLLVISIPTIIFSLSFFFYKKIKTRDITIIDYDKKYENVSSPQNSNIYDILELTRYYNPNLIIYTNRCIYIDCDFRMLYEKEYITHILSILYNRVIEDEDEYDETLIKLAEILLNKCSKEGLNEYIVIADIKCNALLYIGPKFDPINNRIDDVLAKTEYYYQIHYSYSLQVNLSSYQLESCLSMYNLPKSAASNINNHIDDVYH